MDHDDELIKDIAPHVLEVLARKRFFETLDGQMCPADPAQPRVACAGTYAKSTTILTTGGFDPEEIAEITQVLASRGGFCDCEILFNVAEESRLKSEYWKARATGSQPATSHSRHLGG
jgi:hypothetical protein